jgi:hypothetical protein
MKRKLTIVALAALAAAALAAVAFGSDAGSSARAIAAIAKGTGITFVDADHSGKPSLADYELGTTTYVSPATGKAIGRGSVVCTQINTSGTNYQCQGVARFPGGDLVTAGRFSPLRKTYVQAIVGGTGVYSGARGVLRGTWLDAKFSRAKVVFSLEP